jgi:hypothetical protein
MDVDKDGYKQITSKRLNFLWSLQNKQGLLGSV